MSYQVTKTVRHFSHDSVLADDESKAARTEGIVYMDMSMKIACFS